METSDDKILGTSAHAVTANKENKSAIEDESNQKTREKRSIEDEELVNSNLETTNQTLIKEDISPIVKTELKPINQEEIQITNDQELKLDESSVTETKIEDIPKVQTYTNDEIISNSVEENNVQEPFVAVAEPSVQEITLDPQIGKEQRHIQIPYNSVH